MVSPEVVPLIPCNFRCFPWKVLRRELLCVELEAFFFDKSFEVSVTHA